MLVWLLVKWCSSSLLVEFSTNGADNFVHICLCLPCLPLEIKVVLISLLELKPAVWLHQVTQRVAFVILLYFFSMLFRKIFFFLPLKYHLPCLLYCTYPSLVKSWKEKLGFNPNKIRYQLLSSPYCTFLSLVMCWKEKLDFDHCFRTRELWGASSHIKHWIVSTERWCGYVVKIIVKNYFGWLFKHKPFIFCSGKGLL